MFYIFKKKRNDLEKVNELTTLQNQVEDSRLQDRLGKEIFHEDMRSAFQSVTYTVK